MAGVKGTHGGYQSYRATVGAGSIYCFAQAADCTDYFHSIISLRLAGL